MKFVLLILFLGILSVSMSQETLMSGREFQEEMNLKFKLDEDSPLKPRDREAFTALEFFPVDTAFIVTAQFVRTPGESPFYMPTTTERLPESVKYGELYFTLQGKELKLNIYQNKELILQKEYEDYLFLPFTDLTNGVTTYGGGRYLDLRIPAGNLIQLDFNKAYNPYCAYNEKYSCPIPPAENDLYIEIEAGVKDFKKW